MPDKLGTAAWADPALVERRFAYREGTIWLGRLEDNDAAIGYGDDRHVCLVSGNRGGKGTTSIVNNLCFWPGSVVVVDPKGENASVTAARRGAGSAHCEGMGQAVHVLDPFRVAQVDEAYRSRFNPLDAIANLGERSIDAASRLAHAIIVANEKASDPYWDNAAHDMLRGLLLHVLTASQFEGRRHLGIVRQLVTRGDWGYREYLKEGGDENPPSAQELLWGDMSSNPAFNGVVAATGDTYARMLKTSPKQFEGILQVVNQNTRFLDSPAMQRCVAASDFTLSELKSSEKGISLYLSLPQSDMDEHFRWLRMIISLTVSEMELTRGRPKAGAPVLFVLDEFAGLKRMPIIENAVAQIAGHGGKLWFVLQSLEQLKAVYKDNWETFLSNAGLKIFFGIEDHFTREYISKLVGETELIREVHNKSDTFSETDSETSSRTETQGRSRSFGVSYSRGTNESKAVSDSYGTNESESHSTGSSESASWKWGGFLNLERVDEQFNRGTNRSVSRTHGTSRTRGVTQTHGTSTGRTDSDTQGTSTSVGTTTGTSHGTTRGQTSGISETVHKRFLVSPDEIGQLFARVDDRDDSRFPGLALVLIAGRAPVRVRKVNYWEDPAFIERFDPHPDHPERALLLFRLKPEALAPYFKFWPTLKLEPVAQPGDVVLAGQPLFAARVGTTHGASVLSPVDGRVHRMMQEDEDGTNMLSAIVAYAPGYQPVAPLGQLAAWARRTWQSFVTRIAEWKKRRVSGIVGFIVLALLAAAARGAMEVDPVSLVALGGVIFVYYVNRKIRAQQARVRHYKDCFETTAPPPVGDVRPYSRKVTVPPRHADTRAGSATAPAPVYNGPPGHPPPVEPADRAIDSENSPAIWSDVVDDAVSNNVDEASSPEDAGVALAPAVSPDAAMKDEMGRETASVPLLMPSTVPIRSEPVAIEAAQTESLPAAESPSSAASEQPRGAAPPEGHGELRAPFGMSAEEFARLPPAAQEALRAHDAGRAVEPRHGKVAGAYSGVDRAGGGPVAQTSAAASPETRRAVGVRHLPEKPDAQVKESDNVLRRIPAGVWIVAASALAGLALWAWPAGTQPAGPVFVPATSAASATGRSNLQEEVLTGNGNRSFDAGDYQEAAKWYERALQRAPSNADVSTDLGVCYYHLNDPDRALRQFDVTLGLNPRHVKALYNQGVVRAMSKQDFNGAAESWRQVIAIAPSSAEAELARKGLAAIGR